MSAHDIIEPAKPRAISVEGNKGVFEIDGLYPGYGVTIGSSLRRILLSSLSGVAVTSVKIEGVDHEFTTLPGILEDVVTILLNIKKLRFRMPYDDQQAITLSAKGIKEVTGKDMKVPSSVEVITPDVCIATLTDKNAHLEIEMVLEKGLGYVPREQARKDKVEVGMMTLDALFSPVVRANYEVEDMRVGDRTDYNRLRFYIDTDGSISPTDAFQEAVNVIVRQFSALSNGFALEQEEAPAPSWEEASTEVTSEPSEQQSGEDADIGKVKVEDLQLSSRTINALHENGIKTVSGLMRRDAEALSGIPGIGEKALQEINGALGNMGLTLR